MDLLEEKDKVNDNAGAVKDAQKKHYTIGVRHKCSPFHKKYLCYRHEVTPTGHLVLYLIDRSQIAIEIRRKSWIVYADYWDFMKLIEPTV